MTISFTLADLQNRSLEQLYGLYRRIEFELTQAVFGSEVWLDAVACLSTIAKAICIRRTWPYEYSRRAPSFGPGF